MDLKTILAQPDGFTPPDVTVKIEKVWDYKSGTSDKGDWSFQDIQVAGGQRLKLKGLSEFPKDREGLTVTIKAHSSPQHGLTGLKVAHEEYQGKTYDKLVVTKSAKWEFANPAGGNGSTQSAPSQATTNGKRELTYAPAMNDVEPYAAHLMGCAVLAGEVAGVLKVTEGVALQACFATICIDTKNRGILLPKPSTNGHSAPPEESGSSSPWADEPPDDTADF